jgi:hypothetical protein
MDAVVISIKPAAKIPLLQLILFTLPVYPIAHKKLFPAAKCAATIVPIPH